MDIKKDVEIEKARRIVRDVIHHYFPRCDDSPEERLAIDETIRVDGPIVVGSAVDEYGSDASGDSYFTIWIVYDGKDDNLEVERTTEAMREIRNRLLEADIQGFPSAYWVEKSEWEQLFKKWRKSHPDLEIETT